MPGPLSNPRWEAFCQERVFGRKTVVAAFAAAGFKGGPKQAEKCSARPQVRARIHELMEEMKERAISTELYTRETVVRELLENVAESKRQLHTYKGQVSYHRDPDGELILDACGNPMPIYKRDGRVINQALELLGLEQGMFPRISKLEHSKKDPFEGLTYDEILLEMRNTLIAELGWDVPIPKLKEIVESQMQPAVTVKVIGERSGE